MKHWLFPVIAAACLSGCSEPSSTPSGSGGGTSSSSSSAGGGGGGSPAARVSCIDAPDVLARPPSGKLPCEYVPPGLNLPR